MAVNRKARIIVLISGSGNHADDLHRTFPILMNEGTNLQAIIDACQNKYIPAEVMRVISNRKDAYGLARAQKASPPIPTLVHSLYGYKKRYPDNFPLARELYDDKLASLVLKDKPDLVVCAGFMHVLTPKFLNPIAEADIPVINL